MKNIITIFMVLFTMASCTKIINVDLNNAEPKLIIEGIVNNTNPAKVSLTKSVKFSNANTFPTVNGASVKIVDNLNNVFILTETSPGIYTNASLIGVPGRTYNLAITAEGKNYTSSSTMPMEVNLDTITTLFQSFGGSSFYSITPEYLDPIALGNLYLFKMKVNNKTVKASWAFDDKFDNGFVNSQPLFQDDITIKRNDSIAVEMRCIDKNVFRYFVSLQSTIDNNTVPANPDTNITGGSLGYFSAHTSQIQKIKVP
jgi:hypothetical protein